MQSAKFIPTSGDERSDFGFEAGFSIYGADHPVLQKFGVSGLRAWSLWCRVPWGGAEKLIAQVKVRA